MTQRDADKIRLEIMIADAKQGKLREEWMDAIDETKRLRAELAAIERTQDERIG